MKDKIIKILKMYLENTSLSEGNYAYMIEGDDDTLQEIASDIEKELQNECK